MDCYWLGHGSEDPRRNLGLARALHTERAGSHMTDLVASLDNLSISNYLPFCIGFSKVDYYFYYAQLDVSIYLYKTAYRNGCVYFKRRIRAE